MREEAGSLHSLFATSTAVSNAASGDIEDKRLDLTEASLLFVSEEPLPITMRDTGSHLRSVTVTPVLTTRTLEPSDNDSFTGYSPLDISLRVSSQNLTLTMTLKFRTHANLPFNSRKWKHI